MEKVYLKGTEQEGIEITCLIENGEVKRITKVVLYCFGIQTIIPDFSTDFFTASLIYCQIRFDEETKWRNLEALFMERFKDTIIIESNTAYLNACAEFRTRTRHDDEMPDLNN